MQQQAGMRGAYGTKLYMFNNLIGKKYKGSGLKTQQDEVS
jgi:hypothetical protein